MKTKMVFFLLPLTEWPHMEEKFSAMAREGWLIKKLWAGVAVYQRIEPVELSFAVAVYPEARSFEGFDKSKIREFIRQEQGNGWQLAAARQNLQVFYRPAADEGPELRRPFQVGNIASLLRLETVGFSMLLALNLFQLQRFLPPRHHQFYSNISLMVFAWLPFLFLFLVLRLALNGRFLHQAGKGLSLETYPRERAFLSRILSGTGFLSAGIVMLMVVTSMLLELLQSGSQVLLFILPVLLATSVGLGLRKVFAGRNIDPALKTLAMIAGVVVVVFAVSHISFSLADRRDETALPPDRIALAIEDLGGNQAASYTSFRESGSVLVPVHYRYYESTGSDQHVSTTLTVARNSLLGARLFGMQQEELQGYNHYLASAALDYPHVEEAVYAIPSFRARDGSGGGVLLVRDDRYVVSLSVSRNLHDPEIRELLDQTLQELMDN